METSDLVTKTIVYVKGEMASNDSSHDWYHIERVCRLAKTLAVREGLDEIQQLMVELCALLHDIKDWKYDSLGKSQSRKEADMSASRTGAMGVCPQVDAVRTFLETCKVSSCLIDDICYVISRVGFSKQLSQLKDPIRPELDHVLAIVQDADQLDAIGAMGIARCLTYGGAKNNVLYDPDLKPRENLTEKEYKYGKSTTINHFHEKLFKLKDLIKTKSGRQIAEKRHQVMVYYVNQFYNEWNGHDL